MANMLTLLQQTLLSINPWAFHRNPELFGPDCDDFNPERWLDPERARQMDPFLIHVSFLPSEREDTLQYIDYKHSGELDTTNVPVGTWPTLRSPRSLPLLSATSTSNRSIPRSHGVLRPISRLFRMAGLVGCVGGRLRRSDE